MKQTYHWTHDSWGNMVPPKNADEICCAANELIDKYGAQCEYDNDEMQLFSDELWERYCDNDMIDGVRSEWE